MQIVFFVNALKGSLSTKEICALARKYPFEIIPLSDGGDGFLDAVSYVCPKAKKHFTAARNALNKTKKVPYLIYKNSAFLECAKIAGLAEIKPQDRKVLNASSIGIGTVIKDAVKQGVKKIYIGLGGVAFNDGGAGCLQALGYKLLDTKNNEIALGISGVLKLKKIIAPANKNKVKIICLSDVENKLLGPLGSAKIYGPQKGANKKEVSLIERALENFQKVTGKNLDKKFYGASGALPAALCGVLGAEIKKGTAEIFKLVKAENAIKKADLILTSEGCLDRQTLFGKVPFEILKLAKKHKKQIIIICGKNNLTNNVLKKYKNLRVAELCALAKNDDDSFKNARKYFRQVTGEIWGKLKNG